MPPSKSPDDDIARELLELFSTEEQARLRSITHALLALEGGVDEGEQARLFEEILRELHNLKGAALVTNLRDIERVAHALEDFFSAAACGELALGPDACDAAYRALDAIDALMPDATDEERAAVDLDRLLAALAPGDAAWGSQERRSGSGAAVAEEPTAGQREPPASSRRTDDSVRVSTQKLDVLIATVGELQVAGFGLALRVSEVRTLAVQLGRRRRDWRRLRARERDRATGGNAWGGCSQRHELARAAGAAALVDERSGPIEEAQVLDRLCVGLEADARRIAQLASELAEEVRKARMLPLSTLFDGFGRMVRDLARDRGKNVALIVEGGSVQVDRALLDQLRDPLTHLLRNSVDHGVETPQERAAAGKPSGGTIELRAADHGNAVVIEVADDGAGLDVERIRANAVATGVLAAEDASLLGEQEAAWLIFRSGLSTSPAVTEISGRGIGLAVVQEAVDRLQGELALETEPGRGTRFSLRFPLTVTTTRCMLLLAAGETLALPIANVDRIIRVDPEAVESVGGRATIHVAGGPLALVRLSAVLGLLPASPAPDRADRLLRPVIVVTAAGRSVALVVDGLAGTAEVVINNLPPPLLRVRNLSGAAVLADGRAAVVLNARDLVRSPERVWLAPAPAPVPEEARLVVLLVEDSVTTRALERNILEAAGYEVEVAADGGDAWSILQRRRCDVIVSDVMMEPVDGFAFTAKVRADERLKDLPVVLVTSLDSPESRQRAIEVGADAYVVKGDFDQANLLDTIHGLL